MQERGHHNSWGNPQSEANETEAAVDGFSKNSRMRFNSLRQVSAENVDSLAISDVTEQVAAGLPRLVKELVKIMI